MQLERTPAITAITSAAGIFRLRCAAADTAELPRELSIFVFETGNMLPDTRVSRMERRVLS